MRQHFKSRFHRLRARRLNEDVSTDTFFANEKAHNGETMVQLFCGKTSRLTNVFGMTIRKWVAMDGLLSGNTKAQTSKAVADILQQYNIYDMQSEPYQQNQNFAERRIQEVKSMTNTLMSCTGSPGWLWLLCMMYCVFLLNRLAAVSLGWHTPIKVAFGVTPDICSEVQVWCQDHKGQTVR
jgi:hypothetical protein